MLRLALIVIIFTALIALRRMPKATTGTSPRNSADRCLGIFSITTI